MTGSPLSPFKVFFHALLPVLAIAILTFLALWGVQSITPAKPKPAPVPVAANNEAFEFKVGGRLPDLSFRKLGGMDVRLSKLPFKILVVNFWATWCPSCLMELPSLVELREIHQKKGLELVLVNLDEKPTETVPPFLEKLKIHFPTYYDENQKLSELFDIEGLPLTLIIDKDMKILSIDHEERNWSSQAVQKKIEEWLKPK